MKRRKTTGTEKDFSRQAYITSLKAKSHEELIALLLQEREEKIPVSIFRNDLGPLECLVKFLREKDNMSFKQISTMLNRSNKTIWATYDKVKDRKLSITPSRHAVPLSIFSKDRLSILESLVDHLKNTDGLSLHQIALILRRDDRTIWTVHDRARRKLER